MFSENKEIYYFIEMLFYGKFNDFKNQLYKKTEEVIAACNNLLMAMEEDNSIITFMEEGN